MRPFPDVDSGRRVQVSYGGGGQPQWSANGRELFYRGHSEKAMMAVSVTTEPSFSVGVAEPLFEDAYTYGVGPRSYDVGPDGRFLMIEEETAPRQINIVRNWTEELKARVPGTCPVCRVCHGMPPPLWGGRWHSGMARRYEGYRLPRVVFLRVGLLAGTRIRRVKTEKNVASGT